MTRNVGNLAIWKKVEEVFFFLEKKMEGKLTGYIWQE